MIAFPDANYHTARVNSSKLINDASVRVDIDWFFAQKYPRR